MLSIYPESPVCLFSFQRRIRNEEGVLPTVLFSFFRYLFTLSLTLPLVSLSALVKMIEKGYSIFSQPFHKFQVYFLRLQTAVYQYKQIGHLLAFQDIILDNLLYLFLPVSCPGEAYPYPGKSTRYHSLLIRK